MNRSDSPKKQYTPFGVNGQREPILPTTPAGDNTASYDVGFPPITMILKSAGGLPPKGQDMNQILYELANLSRWASTGTLNSFDSSLSSTIGGYPCGAVLLGNDGSTIYISKADNNTADPDSGSGLWWNFSKITAIAGLAGGANKLPYFNGANTAAQTDLTQVGRDVIGQATIASLFTYLGLGTAATKNVGTGSGQIPSMSSFTQGFATAGNNQFGGYFTLPGGLIVQYGKVALYNTSVVSTIPLMLSYADTNYAALATSDLAVTGNTVFPWFGIRPRSASQIDVQQSTNTDGYACYWLTIGRAA